MDDDRAEVTSLATTLDEMTSRITQLAEKLSSRDEQGAAELYEIERMLRQAARRLDRLVNSA